MNINEVIAPRPELFLSKSVGGILWLGGIASGSLLHDNYPLNCSRIATLLIWDRTKRKSVVLFGFHLS